MPSLILVFPGLLLSVSPTLPTSLPPNLSNQITESATALDSLLRSDVIEYLAIEKAIATFSEHLENEKTQNFTLAIAASFRILDHAYDRLDVISARCATKQTRRLIFFILALIRDFNLVGKERIFVCRMESLLAVLESCTESSFFQLVMGVIMSGIDFPAGGICLNGAGRALFEFVNATEFGVSDWDLLLLFAIWGQQMGSVARVDKEAMCGFSERMMKNRAKWDVQLKQYYCWLVKNVKCDGVGEEELAELLGSEECRAFLVQTEQVIGSTEL
jgi:hypothetical protein